eukprot:CAMPEP_0114986346 /NCGR_PEP_ID=MMETSP0216-20121206/8374_1 /TAXON_ID=223996 /ORGANISM="Protocruzia adherens, Strain Boccale" /LENGTH=146 /DNA_ID=CAMNT_0002348769 /DNA_START=1 /DNA_END=441 /DNA_ORIENTATION=-
MRAFGKTFGLVRQLAVALLTRNFIQKFKLRQLDLVPNCDFFTDNSVRLPDGFPEYVEDGTITTVHDTIDTFTDNAILTTSGKEIKTDMVICGTGYTESWDFFSKELQDILVEERNATSRFKKLGLLWTRINFLLTITCLFAIIMAA